MERRLALTAARYRNRESATGGERDLSHGLRGRFGNPDRDHHRKQSELFVEPGGATTDSITVTPALTTTYSVTVTDATTTCVSSAAGTVTVNPLPTVTIAPATTNVECAGTVIFTADPTGEGPLTYQWYDNLTNAIAGETNITLTVSNIYSAAVGNYAIVITGPACSAVAVASLTLIDITAPAITVNGANPATNECHVAYTDAGATASDACAGNVSVTTDNPVDANVAGIYTVTYTADDGNGNTNTAKRTVYVVDTVCANGNFAGRESIHKLCFCAVCGSRARRRRMPAMLRRR